MATITVSRSDIEATKTFKSSPKERQFTLKKKSMIELIENNVNIASHKGVDEWRKQAFLNQSIKSLIIEILISKTK